MLILRLFVLLTCASTVFAEDQSAQLNSLKHWDQAIRRQALQTVIDNPQEHASDAVINQVNNLLRDQNCGVRTLAGEAAYNLSKKTDVSLLSDNLVYLLKDKVATVRQAALYALCNGRGLKNPNVNDLKTLQEDSNRGVRIVALKCSPNRD